MAERRMFAKTIIDSDAFLDMPLSSQALYFHLSMRADDDGFINSPKKVQRMIGASDDNLKLLAAKNFIIPFESGVVVIKHWKIHNYIQSDRYKPTVYTEEKALLETKENKAYTAADTECIHDVSILETQVRLGKVRDSIELGKDRDRLDIGDIDKPKAITGDSGIVRSEAPNPSSELYRVYHSYSFDDNLNTAIKDWIRYKRDQGESYKAVTLDALLSQIQQKANEHGSDAVVNIIKQSMASLYKGIMFDRLEKATNKQKADRYSWIDKVDLS